MFSAGDYAQMRAFFGARPELTATPSRALPGLARELGLGALAAKDESGRFGLNAFKLLGARFAIETLLADGGLRRGAVAIEHLAAANDQVEPLRRRVARRNDRCSGPKQQDHKSLP